MFSSLYCCLVRNDGHLCPLHDEEQVDNVLQQVGVTAQELGGRTSSIKDLDFCPPQKHKIPKAQ